MLYFYIISAANDIAHMAASAPDLNAVDEEGDGAGELLGTDVTAVGMVRLANATLMAGWSVVDAVATRASAERVETTV